MGNNYEFNIIEQLDEGDRYKIKYFIKLLIQQEKYNKLKKEIQSRRKEIEHGEVLTHDEIWTNLDV